MKLIVLVASLLSSMLCAVDVSQSVKKIDAQHQEVTLTFQLKPKEYLYKESLVITVNSPLVTLTEPRPSSPAVSFFDEQLKTQKEGYKGTVSFSFTAQKVPAQDPSKEISSADIHAQYMTSATRKPQSVTIPLQFQKAVPVASPQASSSANAVASSASPIQPTPVEAMQPSLFGTLVQKIINSVHVTVSTTKETVTGLFTHTGSRIIRALAALILGILLSLTPCIYPMIPITVGILQASGTSSAFRNFLLALCYTLGISTTFALFGFLAALGSSVFGELQGSPFFVIPLVIILIYFALTMFDVVHMYIPSWLQPKSGKVKGGSALSAYLFGAISGTVASPCLSPGLILILHYVSQVSHGSVMGYLEGFLLLFLFGIGSSLPLLIIGTFSGSLSVLPRAGQWMVEIKKIVGIMLIGMALYQLSYLERLFPWYLFAWVVVVTFFALGIYYFSSVHPHDKIWLRRYKNIMGTLCVIVGCYMALQGAKAVYDHIYPAPKSSVWLTDYNEALTRARSLRKPLFIDIGATYCSSCIALDKKIFTDEEILEALAAFVPLKILADIQTVAYDQIKSLYGSSIEGFPTYLVINPYTEKVIKKWSTEIDELSIDGIVQELAKVAQLAE